MSDQLPALPATETAISSMTALQAALQINALHETALKLAQTIQAQLMEAAWVIRREIPDQEQFSDFVKLRTSLNPDDAWRMADAWRIARSNRDLREMAQTKPSGAMRFIQQLVDAGVADEENTDDGEVARLLSLPARKRTQEIKRLIDDAQGAQTGHHPADREQIRALTEERDAALAALGESGADANVVGMENHPAAVLRDITERLNNIRREVTAIAEQFKPLAKQADSAARDRICAPVDMSIHMLEEILGDCLDRIDHDAD